MILKGFKQNSNKKYLDEILNSREISIENNIIESLGVLINMDEINDFEMFNQLAKKLKIKANNIKIIAFSEAKKVEFTKNNSLFTPKDFGWKGKINNVELQQFINTKFDALISYYTADILELKLITAKSNANFKIGVLPNDLRLNDLIIHTKLKPFEAFQTELIKYLNIFNKIPNE